MMLQVKVYFLILFATNGIHRNTFCQVAGSKLNFDKVSSFQWTVVAYFHPIDNSTATPFNFPYHADTTVNLSYTSSFLTRNYARLNLKFQCDVDTKLFTETDIIMNQGIEMNYINYECEQSKRVSWPIGIIKINMENSMLFFYSRHPMIEIEALLVLRRSYLLTDKGDVLQQVAYLFGANVIGNTKFYYFDMDLVKKQHCTDFFHNVECNISEIHTINKSLQFSNVWITILLVVYGQFVFLFPFASN